MSALSGLQIVITRPEPAASRWARRLADEGAHPLTAPMMTLHPVDGTDGMNAIKASILEFDRYQKAIFVSQNAVTHAFDWLDRYWPQLPMGVEYFGVGERTAQALAAQGVAVTALQSEGAMNSEALLDAPELHQVNEQRIVIFRGVGGRGLMAETLRQRGAQVEFCELYERRLPADARDALQAAVGKATKEPLIVALHSGETLDNYHHTWQQLPAHSSARQRLAQAPLLVPGERVADQARALGYTRLIVAVNATDSGMRAALSQARLDPALFQTNGIQTRD